MQARGSSAPGSSAQSPLAQKHFTIASKNNTVGAAKNGRSTQYRSVFCTTERSNHNSSETFHNCKYEQHSRRSNAQRDKADAESRKEGPSVLRRGPTTRVIRDPAALHRHHSAPEGLTHYVASATKSIQHFISVYPVATSPFWWTFMWARRGCAPSLEAKRTNTTNIPISVRVTRAFLVIECYTISETVWDFEIVLTSQH